MPHRPTQDRYDYVIRHYYEVLVTKPQDKSGKSGMFNHYNRPAYEHFDKRDNVHMPIHFKKCEEAVKVFQCMVRNDLMVKLTNPDGYSFVLNPEEQLDVVEISKLTDLSIETVAEHLYTLMYSGFITFYNEARISETFFFDDYDGLIPFAAVNENVRKCLYAKPPEEVRMIVEETLYHFCIFFPKVFLLNVC